MSFLKAVAAGLSEDGRTAQLQFLLDDDSTVTVPFPSHHAATAMLEIQSALGTVFEQQRALIKGQDPRTIFAIQPMHPEAIQGGAVQGLPVLSFVLSSKVRLDFALPQNKLRDLIVLLEGLEHDLRSGKTTAH